MIVRNLQDREVLETTYLAHGGAVAQMVLDRRVLKEIGFLAVARLAPGKEIERHGFNAVCLTESSVHVR